jgi:hypothetical protein
MEDRAHGEIAIINIIIMITMARSVIALLAVVCSTAAAFSPPSLSSVTSSRSSSCSSYAPLHAATTNQDDSSCLRKNKNVAASLALATTIFAAVIGTTAVGVEPAMAQDDSFYANFGGSTELLAARSGGRAGGRSSRSYRPSPSAGTTRTRIYNSNTRIIQPSYSPPIIVTPGFGFGYNPFNPFGGYGMGLGFGAAGSVGNAMQDFRQDNEIDRVKSELQAERIKEADMEARLRALENGRATTQQLPPQMPQAQPEAAAVSK